MLPGMGLTRERSIARRDLTKQRCSRQNGWTTNQFRIALHNNFLFCCNALPASPSASKSAIKKEGGTSRVCPA